MKNIFFIFPFVILYISCTRSPQLTEAPLNTEVKFNTSSNLLEKSNVKLLSQLGATEAGDTLILLLDFANSSKDTLWIRTSDIQISNTNQLRSTPIPIDYRNEFVAPKSVHTVKLRFAPVNNLFLYSKTGKPGIIDSIYTLQGQFGILNEDILFEPNLEFEINKSEYTRFKQLQIQESNALFYELVDKVELKESLKTQYAQLPEIEVSHAGHDHGDIHDHESTQKPNNHEASIEILETELMIQGLVLKLNFFQIDSSLQLNARIVNHGDHEIALDTTNLFIKVNNEKIAFIPENIQTTAPLNEAGQYIIRKSGRLMFNSVIESEKPEEFYFYFNGLIYTELDENVFKKALHFKQTKANY
jgi:hypothetical protein